MVSAADYYYISLWWSWNQVELWIYTVHTDTYTAFETKLVEYRLKS